MNFRRITAAEAEEIFGRLRPDFLMRTKKDKEDFALLVVWAIRSGNFCEALDGNLTAHFELKRRQKALGLERILAL